MRTGLRRLGRDTRGATMVEFGLIATPFLALLFAIFEIGYVSFESQLLGAAVTKASRAMLTGAMQTQNITTKQQFLDKMLCPTTGRTLPTSFDCTKFVIDVRPVAVFTSADLSNSYYKSANNQFCAAPPGSITVVRIAYPLQAIFPFNLYSSSIGTVSDFPGASGRVHVLNGTAVFREEAFSQSYTPPPGC